MLHSHRHCPLPAPCRPPSICHDALPACPPPTHTHTRARAHTHTMPARLDMDADCHHKRPCQRPPPPTHTHARTMPARVHMDAEAMCGTMTALGQSASPAFMEGSSSNTSSPHLHAAPQAQGMCACLPACLPACPPAWAACVEGGPLCCSAPSLITIPQRCQPTSRMHGDAGMGGLPALHGAETCHRPPSPLPTAAAVELVQNPTPGLLPPSLPTAASGRPGTVPSRRGCSLPPLHAAAAHKAPPPRDAAPPPPEVGVGL